MDNNNCGVFQCNARIYAEKGYLIFPVYGKSKHVLANGCNEATNDPETIERWKREHPNANIGIKAGDRILVLDIDNKGDKNGSMDLEEIETELGKLPLCPIIETPTGGKHLYYKKPDADVIGSVGVKWKGRKTGIDIRVGNQYVIAPPSIPPDTQMSYTTKFPLCPSDELPELPQAWVEGFLPLRGGTAIIPKTSDVVIHVVEVNIDPALEQRAKKYLEAMPKSISGEGGHNVLFAAVRAMYWGFGFDSQETKYMITRYFNPRCRPAWNEKEIDHKIDDIPHFPTENPRGCLREKVAISKKLVSKKFVSIKTIKPKLIDPTKIEERKMRWLWFNKIALGALSVIAGNPGLGKSFWTCYMAAIITNGWDWADGAPCQKGAVVFFYGEDTIEDTYKQRLRANGADQSKIRFLDGAELISDESEPEEIDFTLKNIDVIEKAMEQTEEETGLPVLMVVIDPISNFWGDINENSNSEVRSVLKPLARLADRAGAAFVMIQHTGKSNKEHAQHRIIGSVAIAASSRFAWRIYEGSEKGRRIFAPIKSNCCVDPTAVEFLISREVGGQVQILNASLEKTGDDLELEHREKRSGNTGGRKKDAVSQWLIDFLRTGPQYSDDIFSQGKVAGHSERTLYRVKKEIGILAAKESDVNRWTWFLPPEMLDGPESDKECQKGLPNSICTPLADPKLADPSVNNHPDLNNTGNTGLPNGCANTIYTDMAKPLADLDDPNSPTLPEDGMSVVTGEELLLSLNEKVAHYIDTELSVSEIEGFYCHFTDIPLPEDFNLPNWFHQCPADKMEALREQIMIRHQTNGDSVREKDAPTATDSLAGRSYHDPAS